MCASIQYAPSFVTCGCLCESFKHACVCICVYVGGFRTLGLHRVEGPAQELLIERDLRDMAGVSMLQHTETGLWWAVKTSRRLKTTAMSIYAVVCMCVCELTWVHRYLCGVCDYVRLQSVCSESAVCLYTCTVRCRGARVCG